MLVRKNVAEEIASKKWLDRTEYELSSEEKLLVARLCFHTICGRVIGISVGVLTADVAAQKKKNWTGEADRLVAASSWIRTRTAQHVEERGCGGPSGSTKL